MSTEAILPSTMPDTTTRTTKLKSRRNTRQPALPPPTETGPDDTAPHVASNPPPTPASQPNPVAAELPEEVVAFLVRSAPPREVWKWLCNDDRRHVLHQVTRGFQRTANALRQTVVRSRLVHHLQQDDEAFYALLHLWGEATPPPKAVSDVRALDDAALIERLPALWHWMGLEALLLALLLDDRRAALDALDDLAEEELASIETVVETADESAGTADGDTATEAGAASPVVQSAVAQKAERRKAGRRRADSAPEDEPAPVTDALSLAQSQAAEWRQRAEQAEKAVASAEAATATQREQWLAETRALNLHLKQEQRRTAAAGEDLKESRHVLDRTARRLKSMEKDLAEIATENKRLKRQMRVQQQLSEELRKQLASAATKLQQLTEAKKTVEPDAAADRDAAIKGGKQAAPLSPQPVRTPRAPVAPHDQVFLWKSDGRQFRVTPREVKRAIDANDEEFVFTLIQALDALRETNEPGYRLFLDRIREFDRYYGRVLTTDTTRVVVDASNVVRYENDRYGKGQLRHLLGMRDELRRRGCFPILMYADASLRYHIDEPDELLAMAKRCELEITPAGQEADEHLAREARRTGAYVVTNDRNFHLKVSPDYEPPRITFRIYDGFLVVDDF